MRSELFAAAAVVVAATAGVRFWEASQPQDNASAAQTPAAQSLTRPSLTAGAAPHRAGWSDEVRIAASRDHQYYVTAAVNDWPASFLVDTGAGYVALRDSDARRAGVYTNWTDFTHPVRTANGETKAARVRLDVIEIDGIRIEGVDAFILQDDQLGVNLLGMSFLSRLESVEARAGVLVLRG